jgi:hypothetical protein
MRNLIRNEAFSLYLFPVLAWSALVSVPCILLAQTTISTGSIQGTVTDPTGAASPGAAITLTNKATAQIITLTSSNAGTYNSGALIPGTYFVRVADQGFKTFEFAANVQVGVTSPGSIQLEIGLENTVVTVEASENVVNAEQAIVGGVMTPRQIENLPIGGRNFLDLAQLQPGVQIQDGGNFDPTKNGMQSISFGGRFGRTARIELDGVDISDEAVGTTTQNVPASGIQEFQVSQSTLDLSTELTSSGAVNVVTSSGTNEFHGESFVVWRSNNTSARFGNEEVPFDRQQYGVNFGGPVIKDRLFFFADWERTVQDLFAPVELFDPFAGLSGGFNSPFHESMVIGRLDWQIKSNMRAFYRFTYDQNDSVRSMIPNSYQPFRNRNNTPVQAAGLDFNTGTFTHSIRFGYTRFRNGVADAVAGTAIPNPAPSISLGIGNNLICLGPGNVFCSGPNILAPQSTLQRNTQIKYDGSKMYGSHIFRYGFAFNRILGFAFADFLGLAPAVLSNFDSSTEAIAAAGPFSGGASNPLNYPVQFVLLGNGQGYFSEIPQFGFPAGGLHDNRIAFYIGDSWKARPNLTLAYGLRYVRDTGRSDSDLGPIEVLNQLQPGLGASVHQPNLNFAPQLGVAWDPWKNGRTVLRAGTGLFYENAIFNNVLFDRPGRLTQGLFNGVALACSSGSANDVTFPNGTTVTPTFCGQLIGSVADGIGALQQQYQAAIAQAGPQTNPNFIGNAMFGSSLLNGIQLFTPDYRTPYSFQLNAGIQHQFGKATVLSVDYLRNVGLHYLLGIDANRTGDAGYLDVPNAMAAIAATHASFGCPGGLNGIDCSIAAGAKISDYAANGLTSITEFTGGAPGSAAFAGMNPTFGSVNMNMPVGRSVYNALQVSLRSTLQHPIRGLNSADLQVSYALSRFDSMSRDQDFLTVPFDQANIGRYFGPTALDRTHQFSFGAVLDFPTALQVSLISHIYTALPATMTIPAVGTGGEIFQTDLTGDGTTSDPPPGTNIGSFGRGVSAQSINNIIDSYNSTAAGHLTPAGQALVSAGLFTPSQLSSLGAVTPAVLGAPAGQVNQDSLLAFDLRFGWVLRPQRWLHFLPETFTLQPTVAVFNLFNFANYDGPNQPLVGTLTGQPGSVNGTTQALRTNRIGLGSGVFALGAPRQFEFGVKVTF